MQQLPFTLPPNVQMGQIRVQQPHMQQHHQLDGNGNREFDEEEEPQADHDQPGSSTRRKREKQPSRAGRILSANGIHWVLSEAEKVLAKLLATIQLDGGGGGMSDSSSEEEEEENDPLRRIADKIGGDGAVDEGDNVSFLTVFGLQNLFIDFPALGNIRYSHYNSLRAVVSDYWYHTAIICLL